jgi:hypothetical protein
MSKDGPYHRLIRSSSNDDLGTTYVTRNGALITVTSRFLGFRMKQMASDTKGRCENTELTVPDIGKVWPSTFVVARQLATRDRKESESCGVLHRASGLE